MPKNYDVAAYVAKVNEQNGDPLVTLEALQGSPTMVAMVRGTVADVLIGECIIPVDANGNIATNPADAVAVLWPNAATRRTGNSHITSAANGGVGHKAMDAWREAFGTRGAEIKTKTRAGAEKALSTYLTAYGKAVSGKARVASTAKAKGTPKA